MAGTKTVVDTQKKGSFFSDSTTNDDHKGPSLVHWVEPVTRNTDDNVGQSLGQPWIDRLEGSAITVAQTPLLSFVAFFPINYLPDSPWSVTDQPSLSP